MDSEKCEILKTKVRKFRNASDYIIKPFIPRYIDKVDNFNKNQQKLNSPASMVSNYESSTDSIKSRLRFGSTSSIK